MKKILVSLTTAYNPEWREAIEDLDRLGIKEIACFPTGAGPKERREMYRLLEASNIKSIPHVHVRDDMEKWELDFFKDKYGTRLFNIHPWPVFKDFLDKHADYKEFFFVENMDYVVEDFESYLELSSGLCIDFSHWHDFGVLLAHETYKDFKKYLERYPVGCAHISAISKAPNDNGYNICHSSHEYTVLAEFDYLRDYLEYLPDMTSIELTNSIEEQLAVKKYLENMLK